MATVRQQTIPLADYPSGSRGFNVNIPDTANQFYFEFARCTTADPTIWPNDTTVLETQFSMSVNGGPLVFMVGFTAKGGIFNSRGVDVPLTTWTGVLPQGLNRTMRIDTTITGGPLRTQGFAELRD